MNKYICFNNNEEYISYIEEVLLDRKKEILDFFETTDNGTFNFNIYVYNTLQELHNALNNKNIVTNKISYQIGNSLYFFESNDNFKEKYKQKIFNEEIRGIEHLIYGNHPKWLSDGIVMYINKVDLETIINNENINELEEPYSSYIIVSYLIEKYTKYLFIRLICIKQFIDCIEHNNVLEQAINYYKIKDKIKIIKP